MSSPVISTATGTRPLHCHAVICTPPHKTKPFKLCIVSLSENISEFGLELDSVFLLQDKTFEIIVQLPF
jgi:hypothetical protein